MVSCKSLRQLEPVLSNVHFVFNFFFFFFFFFFGNTLFQFFGLRNLLAEIFAEGDFFFSHPLTQGDRYFSSKLCHLSFLLTTVQQCI